MPGERIDVIHPCGLQKCGNRRPCPPAAVGSGEGRILAGDGLWPDRALDGVAIDVAPTVEEALEGLAAAPGVSDGLGEVRFARDARQLLFPERPEFSDDGLRLFLPRGAASLGVLGADFFLDRS